MRRLIRGAVAVLVAAGALLVVPLSASVGGSDNEAGLVVSHDRRFIDEGSSKSFTVKLASRPQADDPGTDVVVSDDVSVQVWSSDQSVVTVNGADADGNRFLTFTSSNWNTAQTVTVTAVSDSDRVDEMTDIKFNTGSADADYYDLNDTVTVVVLETQRDAGTATSVSADRRWYAFHSRYAVWLEWSGNEPGENWVYRRNISRGETEFTYIHAGLIISRDPNNRSEYDSSVQAGINLYRVGSGDASQGTSALNTSRTVAVYFYPAGGA